MLTRFDHIFQNVRVPLFCTTPNKLNWNTFCEQKENANKESSAFKLLFFVPYPRSNNVLYNYGTRLWYTSIVYCIRNGVGRSDFEKKLDTCRVVPNCFSWPPFQNFTLKCFFLTWRMASENFDCYTLSKSKSILPILGA